MKKMLCVASMCFALVAAAAFADKVHDWHDLDKVHTHVKEAIKEMAEARKANHYDMDSHGAKAEDLLKQAEVELKEAVESAKKAK